MKNEINNEALQQLEKYVNSADSPETRRHIEEESLTLEETSIILPTIVKLYVFGASIAEDTKERNQLNYWAENAVNDEFTARRMVVVNKGIILDLIAKYRADMTAKERHKLFNLKIVEMNGYQFREYLKEIGVIK